MPPSSKQQHRPLLIPSKRALLPLSSTTKSPSNPSAYPAEIQIRRPAFSSAVSSESADTSCDKSEQRESSEPIIIEFDSSRAPQPFLDPVALERVRERMRMREEERRQEGERTEVKEKEEDDEQQRRRREREAEYGGMAVRGRSRAVAGRGGGRK